jgi:hypothetical protein
MLYVRFLTSGLLCVGSLGFLDCYFHTLCLPLSRQARRYYCILLDQSFSLLDWGHCINSSAVYHILLY